jgi:hypothetical protein
VQDVLDARRCGMTARTRGPYQLLPPLSEDEYAALREDIRGAGVRVPIDVDEDGNILDGHHRKAIADELGVECPERIVRGLPDFAKVDYALTVNLTRRHLTREQRRDLVTKSLKRDPRVSDREHARRCGVSHTYVSGVREALEAAEQLATVASRIGKDGRERPTQTAGSGLGGPDPAQTGVAAPEEETDASGASSVGSSTAPGGGLTHPPSGAPSPSRPELSGSEEAGASTANGAPAPDSPGVTASGVPGDGADPASAPEQGGPAPLSAGSPCEKCGTRIAVGQAIEGYTRCDECDPEGDHVDHGEGCRGCKVAAETDPAYVLSFGENEHGLHLECGECDGVVAHLKPGGSLPEVLAAARTHYEICGGA